jgi:hypothetical protein
MGQIKCFGRLRKIWEDKKTIQCDWECDYTIDDEPVV